MNFVNVFEFEQPGVVVSAIGARCGKCFYATDKWTTLANTQSYFGRRIQNAKSLLWYLINDESYWHRSGTAQPFIKPTDIQNAWIPVPPPNEQKQIVDRLDFDGIHQYTQKSPYKKPRIVSGTSAKTS